ncbi:alpha/beta fold hydrolase [Sporosarcina pasteurii]|uniref:3-oxoadipate enol-lactonase 2 n=1 Tax=Sporosarcina pasteurii TaxID=1474 RepID=A0A380C2X7_SPOPA|nr:alpha/beta fold hydrolase [Sporosarcina pasteurii]MDS9471537.1 alpha/beta fold hydrolase [Sporosarcina pasteurii]QBQ04847.1 alpha/beta fold hydrolase [Sporosarcina pasteurii]SUJ10761.1 3-oxoadipate enol-lactonase 2 [Sporosarcina pasteurii]
MPKITYGQKTIHYEEKGTGEPLVFIHGVGLDHAMWEQQVNSLSEYYRVIVYDMIGHGESSHPPGPYSLSKYVEQLAALVESLSLEKIHLVGFSMGGMVAQAYALSNSAKMKTLTIMNAVANRTEMQRQAILKRVEEVRANGAHSTIEPAIQRWFTTDYLQNQADVVNRIRTRLQTNNPASYLEAYSLFATADQELWDKLDQITVPTLVITAENDVGSTPEMSQQIHQKISGSELLVVPVLRHMLPIERPDIIHEAIHSFIERAVLVGEGR